MRASLEIHAGTLRIGAKHEKYGDEYEWSCTVTFEDGGSVAVLHGVVRAPTPSMIRAGRKCLRGYGVKIVRFERRAGGERRRFVEAPIA